MVISESRVSANIMQKLDERVYEDNSVYKGELSNGEKSGKGSLTYSDGTQYNGGFVGGLQDGMGVMKFPDKSSAHTYEGQFQKGCFHGYGVFIQSNGMKYEGEFKEGSITGHGLVTFADGSNGVPRHEGLFEDGKLKEQQICAEHVTAARKAADDARNYIR